jgi:hypothetical protein
MNDSQSVHRTSYPLGRYWRYHRFSVTMTYLEAFSVLSESSDSSFSVESFSLFYFRIKVILIVNVLIDSSSRWCYCSTPLM